MADLSELKQLADPYTLAQRFHETYERLAPSFGYETRKESAVPWEDVLEANRRLMTAVVQEVMLPIVALLDVVEAAQRERSAEKVLALGEMASAEQIRQASRDLSRAIRDRRAALSRLEESP